MNPQAVPQRPRIAFSGGPGVLPGRLRFLDHGWLLEQPGGECLVGALIDPRQRAAGAPVRTARVGERVEAGLPLAAFRDRAGRLRLLPAPVSGRVIACNPRAIDALGWPDDSGLAGAWMLRLGAVRPAAGAERALDRLVVLLRPDGRRLEPLDRRLAALGCRLLVVRTLAGLAQAVCDNRARMALLDATTLDAAWIEPLRTLRLDEPQLELVAAEVPAAQLVSVQRCGVGCLLGSRAPLATLVEVLDKAFRPARRALAPAGAYSSCATRQRLSIRDGDGRSVCLLVARAVLEAFDGLGRLVISGLAERGRTVVVGARPVSFERRALRAELQQTERLLLLRAVDRGRIPGSLITGGGPAVSSVEDGALTELEVQVGEGGAGPRVFDLQTTRALADRVVERIFGV